MKKIVLGLSIVALAVSCKKLPEGGNKGVLKLEEGVERYTDDTHQHELEAPKKEETTTTVSNDSTNVKKDSVNTEHTGHH